MGFLVRCHKTGSEVLMCPWCSAVYDRKAAEAFERIPSTQYWNNQRSSRGRYVTNAKGIPKREDSPHPRVNRQVTFKPPSNIPIDKWMESSQSKGKGKGKGKWQNFEECGRSAWAYQRQFQSTKEQAYVSENYKGKNQMTRTQW